MMVPETAKAAAAVGSHDLRNIERIPGQLASENIEIAVAVQVRFVARRCRLPLERAALIASLAFESGGVHG